MSRLIVCVTLVMLMSNSTFTVAQNNLLNKKGATPKSGLTAKGMTPRSGAPKPQTLTINWLSWEEAMELNKKEKRKILLDVFTYWCGWCKKMDAETFTNPYLIKFLNEHYYLVKLDAESKESLAYKGKEFHYIKNAKGGHHELAEELLRGQLSFPSIVFLDENLDIIQPIPGFRDAEELLMISTYFGTGKYKEMPWSVFQKEFKMPEGFKR